MDPELGLAAAMKHENGCQANVSPKAGRRCVIAVQHLDGRAIPINAIIEEVDGSFVLNSTQKQIFQTVTRNWIHRLVGNLVMGLVVGTARVKQVSPPSGSQLDVSHLADFSSSRLRIAGLDRVAPDIADRHFESTLETSLSTPYSQKHFSTRTSS